MQCRIGAFSQLSGSLCRDRVMGNPRFLRVLAVEEVLGCTAKTIAEVQARGAKVWEELDFLASDLSLEARWPGRW